MQAVARPLDLARSGPWLGALLLIALVAFWPTYLAPRSFITSSGYTHFHAATATLWMMLLVAQPLAIRTRHLSWHRLLGKASYVLAPLVLLSIALLAHNRLQGLASEGYAIQTYILYLQVSLAVVFGTAYALAIATRRSAAKHARFMICTAITLIDPVVVRMMLWVDPTPDWNYQWFTFGLTDLVLVGLIVLERHSRVGRWVFPAMLALFVATQAPALLALTETQPWQAFARWYAALPLT